MAARLILVARLAILKETHGGLGEVSWDEMRCWRLEVGS